MSRFFIINNAGSFYSHVPGRIVLWDTLPKANEFQSAQSAKYVSEKYPGSRVIEMRGKNVCEVPA